MTNRRQFLHGLSTLAGSLVLTACGGGGGGSSATSAVSSGTTPSTPTSGGGSATPSTTTTTTTTTTTATVGSTPSSGNTTSAVTSVGGSPDGTTIPPATSITDKSGAIWTVVQGVVYVNGAAAGSSWNVSMLLWYGGMIYQVGTGGQFYVWNTNGLWLACSDPRIAVAATAGTFYGMNGHYDYAFTPAQILGMLQQLRCTIYRVGCVNNATQLYAMGNLAQTLIPAGVSVFALINESMYDSNGNLYTSESIAYNQGYSTGAAVATALMPYGVTMYECGNELTRDASIILNSAAAGNQATDFNNTNWPIMRGLMRGLMAGVKSVQAGALCGINFCVADIAAADCLWDGTQPDGSSGYPTVRWDLTTWHNYQVYGDIFDIGTDGASPGFNLPIYCKARYGVPFMITEWNANPEDSETFRGSYITEQLGEFYAARTTDNIRSVMYYELDSGNDTWGIVTDSGAAIDPPYSAFQSFADANADS